MSEAMTFDVAPSNSRQVRDWDGEHGSYWAENADLYDRSLAALHRVRAPSGSTSPLRNSTWPAAAGPGWRWSSPRPTRRCTTSGRRRTT